ncbi:MAG: hypothetical protein WC091_12750 [Sulfuricellaceae bacterium]
MEYMLDAWLERRDPVVRLIDVENRATLAEWRGEPLRKLLEEGFLEWDCLLESALQFLGRGQIPLKKFTHEQQ